MPDTLFGKIIRREIPADIVYEDDEVLAFRDINPQAPVHVLFIPKKAIATLNDIGDADAALIGKLVLAAVRWAKAAGIRRGRLSLRDQLQRTAARPCSTCTCTCLPDARCTGRPGNRLLIPRR